jgi:hypothetical protein
LPLFFLKKEKKWKLLPLVIIEIQWHFFWVNTLSLYSYPIANRGG